MSIFQSQTAAVETLRGGPLALAAAHYPQLSGLSDDFLFAKLLEAEKELGRRLGIPLSPVEVFPDPPTVDELTALNGAQYRIESGYNLPPNFFNTDRWGLLKLRLRPIIAVHGIKLVYPLLGLQVVDVPTDWIRIDHRHGQVHIIPATLQGSSLLASTFLGGNLFNGQTIPNMIRVRYLAGIDVNNGGYPDVVGLVYRMTTLRLLQDSFLPQSGSISADGLSQSVSVNVSAMQTELDNRIDVLKKQLIGPVWDVL